MKKSKFVINIFIIFVVLIIVLYFSLKDNYLEIIDTIRSISPFWLGLGIVLFVLYRVCSSLGHYLIIEINNEHVSYFRCLQINFIILFFHGVTPFASGGQPMEVYYLHNEKIPITKSTNITLQNFIVYQISLILVGIFAIGYNAFFGLFPSDSLIKKLVVFGFLINVLVLFLSFAFSFGKRFNQFICTKGIHFLYRIRVIKDEDSGLVKVRGYLDNFHHNALELKKNRLKVIGIVLVDVLGLIFYYSIPFVVFCGLGLDISFVLVIVATAYIMIIGSFVPIPGGTGGIEYSFVFFFSFFIHGSSLQASMLLWRFVSYYLGMIIGGVVLSFYRKRERICE